MHALTISVPNVSDVYNYGSALTLDFISSVGQEGCNVAWALRSAEDKISELETEAVTGTSYWVETGGSKTGKWRFRRNVWRGRFKGSGTDMINWRSAFSGDSFNCTCSVGAVGVLGNIVVVIR